MSGGLIKKELVDAVLAQRRDPLGFALRVGFEQAYRQCPEAFEELYTDPIDTPFRLANRLARLLRTNSKG
jgi:hypothetical protein